MTVKTWVCMILLYLEKRQQCTSFKAFAFRLLHVPPETGQTFRVPTTLLKSEMNLSVPLEKRSSLSRPWKWLCLRFSSPLSIETCLCLSSESKINTRIHACGRLCVYLCACLYMCVQEIYHQADLQGIDPSFRHLMRARNLITFTVDNRVKLSRFNSILEAPQKTPKFD